MKKQGVAVSVHSAIALSVIVAFGLPTKMVLAGVLTGPGNSQILDQNANPAETWNVSNEATLIFQPGGASGRVNITRANLQMDGGQIMTATAGTSPALDVAGGNADINNSVIGNSLGMGMIVTRIFGGGSSTVTVNNSQISGLRTGMTVGEDTTVTLANTTVNGARDPSYDNSLNNDGVGITHYGGNLNITSGSQITGETNGIMVEDEGFLGDAKLTDIVLSVDNSRVEGKDGSAIVVRRIDDLARETIAEITVSNGSVLTGSNGEILHVMADASVNFNVENSQLNGNIVNDAGGTANINLNDGAVLNGSVSNATSLTTNKNSEWVLTDSSDVGALTNGGTVAFSEGEVGRTLTVNGNYSGNDGLLAFNTVLGDDSSLTDKLVVTGDTSGTTRVSVNNLGGSGAKTLNGIELINVQGNSAGEFVQQGRIVAGAYDYELARGEDAQSGNWYLNSGEPDGPVDPTTPATLIVRPEAGAYASNLAAANTLFTSSLDDRLGETEYTDAITGEKKMTSLWLRTSGGHSGVHDSSGQLKTQSNRFVTMLGGDMATGRGSAGSSWRLGALAGYGNSRSNTVSAPTGYHAKGEVNGYTTGVYATWYASGSDEKGLYLDGIAQYSWFNNTVNGEDLAGEKYKSNGWSSSLEGGYVFRLSQNARSGWYLQPKVQVGWSGITANDHTERNGSRITGSGDDNIRTVIGVKSFIKGHSAGDDGRQRNFKPFIEANYIHNTRNYGVVMDGVQVDQNGTRNIAEMKLGIEGRLSEQLNVTGYVAQQMGDQGYADTAGILGIKYSY